MPTMRPIQMGHTGIMHNKNFRDADTLRGWLSTSHMERGYSITRTEDGRIVKTVKGVRRGDKLRTLVADGEISSVAEG